MTTSTSNIRAFVQWNDQTVFAGETVECKITFKNTAPTSSISRSNSLRSKSNSHGPVGDRKRKSTAQQMTGTNGSTSAIQSPQLGSSSRSGHRPTLSLNVPVGTSRNRNTGSWSAGQNGQPASGHKHVRSVSIISMGGSDIAGEDTTSSPGTKAPQRPQRNHMRSASLQIVPRRSAAHSASRSIAQSSPLFHTSTPPSRPEPQSAEGFGFPPTQPRSKSGTATAPNTPGIPRTSRPNSGSFSQSFRFPGTGNGSSNQDVGRLPFSPGKGSIPATRTPSPRSPDETSESEHLPPMTRIFSGSSMNGGTPRSSGEFYSMSNNSTETLASEYQPQPSQYLMPRPSHLRRQSHLAPSNHQRVPETIMMGYAQVMGSFVLDGSLVNQAPFEEVKRKGVVGGQGGGGVVGVESSKRESGILGAFGWGSIGTSIGDLLGTGELSTVKEMRGIASAKDIPLLSTPQSVLFVDLRLAPGESRAYSYSFTLPKGLPPSHKGRAIKVSYNLVIGSQRAGSAKDRQQVRHVDVPFRVFGSVDGRGEILGHDLMSPYIFLQDEAKTKSTDDLGAALRSTTLSDNVAKAKPKGGSSIESFLSYVDNLLENPRPSSSAGLLSPTEQPSSRRLSIVEGPSSMKEAIDLAILRSNFASASNQSSNRFEIARNGRRVAVVMLARPAYRLGETVTAIIDFSEAEIPCYSIHASLETSEKVDSAIALRSTASINRVTRRSHASHSESALFAKRVVFAPTIPITATPEFLTSGVSLEWKLRVEFVTPRVSHSQSEDEIQHSTNLLEEVASDERGQVLAAVERLQCESFEIAVPVRVFGSVIEGESGTIGGLVI